MYTIRTREGSLYHSDSGHVTCMAALYTKKTTEKSTQPCRWKSFCSGHTLVCQETTQPINKFLVPVGRLGGVTEAALTMSDGLMPYDAGPKSHIIPGIPLTTQTAWETQIASGMLAFGLLGHSNRKSKHSTDQGPEILMYPLGAPASGFQGKCGALRTHPGGDFVSNVLQDCTVGVKSQISLILTAKIFLQFFLTVLLAVVHALLQACPHARGPGSSVTKLKSSYSKFTRKISAAKRKCTAATIKSCNDVKKLPNFWPDQILKERELSNHKRFFIRKFSYVTGSQAKILPHRGMTPQILIPNYEPQIIFGQPQLHRKYSREVIPITTTVRDLKSQHFEYTLATAAIPGPVALPLIDGSRRSALDGENGDCKGSENGKERYEYLKPSLCTTLLWDNSESQLLQ
ncbi:hypothetical protein FB45DRAFT_873377 [Roridomyces roridus]|uniref:Uncharacterized protein n=1 Tax=Roridomyces roridus TaxID=1738132 RepID=A0AAD7BBR6_9AGAR|nr:hypothetical protein FB45DRAFT_873377 [Roridomyces roridus]